jgi:hypothetical protein
MDIFHPHLVRIGQWDGWRPRNTLLFFRVMQQKGHFGLRVLY